MKLECFEDVPERVLRAVDDGLSAFNRRAAPLEQVRTLGCAAHSDEGRLLGGAVGRTWGACAELQQLWVEEAVRSQGVGAALLEAFETEARRRGCAIVFLDTFSFQARPFYERHGYAVALAIEGYGDGITRFTMLKRLTVGG